MAESGNGEEAPPTRAEAPASHDGDQEDLSLEEQIVSAVSDGDVTKVQALLVSRRGDPNFCDKHGMTPLHHAAYKGIPQLVQLLLDQGADVNSGKHEYNYTALHFGALSGNADVCQMLLMAGVKVDARNSVGRTAAQMAAFVGNYHVVAKINNFIPKSRVDYFTKSQNPDSPPMLSPLLGDQLHKFIMEVNLNPVRVALNLYRSPALADHLESVKKVLEALCEKEMNKGSDNDEVLSFKLHYLSYLVGEIHDIRQRHIASKEQKKDENGDEKKVDFVELFSRKLLKPGKDGVTLDYQDGFLKEGVRKFPFRQCVIFRQAVSTLAQKDSPSTLSVIDSVINGQRGFANNVPYCNTCGEEKPAKKCSKCKSVQYCDRECQRLHWFIHKKACTRLASAPITASVNSNQRKVDTAELSQHLQDLVTG